MQDDYSRTSAQMCSDDAGAVFECRWTTIGWVAAGFRLLPKEALGGGGNVAPGARES